MSDTDALDQLMRTTFAGRTFTDDEVADADVEAILDVARFAPSGGNRQGWRVVVCRDPETKTALVELAAPFVRAYAAQAAAGENPLNTVTPTSVDLVEAMKDESIDVSWFIALADAPVLLIVGVDLSVVASMDRDLDRIGLVSGASIYPFVQNINLAARARGLTTALTTFISAAEPDVQRLLGMPSHVAVAAMVPLGHPTKVLSKLNRKPVSSFARIGSWSGPPFGE